MLSRVVSLIEKEGRGYPVLLSCPQCQAQYDLDPAKLGTGRVVRCVSCSHTWFQDVATEVIVTKPPMETPPPVTAPATESPPATFAETVAAVATAEPPPAASESVAVVEDVAGHDTPPSPPPPRQKTASSAPASPPVITHNPFGLSANAFGVAVFGLCLALTAPVAWIFKDTLFHKPPELFHFEDVTADVKDGTLAVSAKITNATKDQRPTPELHVVAQDSGHRALRSWTLKGGGKTMASGETLPMVLKLPNAPDGVARVEIRAKEEKAGHD